MVPPPSEPRRSAISTFQQQVDRLVELGYPALAGSSEPAFRERVAPLRGLVEDDFVLVITRDVVSPYDTVPLLRLAGGDRPGRVDRNHPEGDLTSYHPIEGCAPPGEVYLLAGVQRGEEFCGVRPEDAVRTIRSRGRTPLTIDEGIALVTQRPEVLEKNKCFMVAGSRRTGLPGDRRVPALWISERAPKLGWCWDGNPHSWLGTASCVGRIG